LARAGSTEEFGELAKLEGVSPEKFRDRVARGQIVVIRNVKRPPRRVTVIGRGVSTKINVNLGTSSEVVDLDAELKKVAVANRWGDTLMDLSVGGDLDAIRRAKLDASEIPVSTVPVYQAFIESFARQVGGAYFTEEDLFKTVERHLKDGVAFMTIRAAVTYDLAVKVLRSDRVIPVVSRGGDMLIGWMIHNKAENTYLKNWDYLLELFAEHDAVISIGDALRPGAVADAHDEFHVAELVEAARLAKRAVKKGVQVMIEGPGHVPLHRVEHQAREAADWGHSVLRPWPSADRRRCALRPHSLRRGRRAGSRGRRRLIVLHHARRAPNPAHGGAGGRGG
jgi:thiamine biosynthesis protein ThiC